MLFELVAAAVAAYFLTDEVMALREWIGGAMIISASLFSARMNRDLNWIRASAETVAPALREVNSRFTCRGTLFTHRLRVCFCIV